MSKIGDRIKERRITLGLTQEELANRMGYKSKSTINKVESGKNDVNQTTASKYANKLGVSVAYLLGWTDDINYIPDEKAEALREERIHEESMQNISVAYLTELTGYNMESMIDDLLKLNRNGLEELHKRLVEMLFVEKYTQKD